MPWNRDESSLISIGLRVNNGSTSRFRVLFGFTGERDRYVETEELVRRSPPRFGDHANATGISCFQLSVVNACG